MAGLNTGLYDIAPGESSSDAAQRRKMALALMQEGMSTDAIKSPWQGVANIAKSLIGGYDLGKLEQEEKAKERVMHDQYEGVINQASGGGMPSPIGQMAPMNRPSPVAAALVPGANGEPARPEVQSSATVMGDREGQAAGIYPSTPGMGPAKPSPVATALAGSPATTTQPQPQMTGQPPRQPPPMSPEQAQMFRRMNTPEQRRAMLPLLMDTLKPKDTYRVLQPGERTNYGLSPDDKNAYQVDSSGKVHAVNPQPFAVNVNNQGESEFSKEAAKHQAARFDKLAAEAPAAKQMINDLDTLKTFGEMVRTGKGAELTAAIGPWADAVGINVNGLGSVQAYESAVNRIAPNLRVPGSGSQSDLELRNFLKSMPSLGTTPEGNALIDRTTRALYENKVRASEIGSMALNGEISRSEAEKRLRNLPDSLVEWRKAIKANPGAVGGGVGGAGPQRIIRYDANGKPL